MLVARGADGAFTEQRQSFEVKGLTAASSSPEKRAEDNAQDAKVGKKDHKKAVRIEFFPEGGEIAAGISNRVYFAARDGQGQPLEIRGDIVNSKGDKVAKLESSGAGRGRFDYTPVAAESYGVQVSEPKNVADALALPAAAQDQKVVIAAEHGVVAPGASIELSLHATKNDLPLVIVASVGNTLIGEQMVLTTTDKAGQQVALPLDDRVAGIIRVDVYDCTKSPPGLVAERFFFRQPRRSTITADTAKQSEALRLLVRDDKGQPVAAAIGVFGIPPHARRIASPARRARKGASSAAMCCSMPRVQIRAELADAPPAPTTAREARASGTELALGCQTSSSPQKIAARR